MKIKHVIAGAFIGTSAIVFMLHRLPRKSEVVEKPADVKPPAVVLHAPKTHKIASAHKYFRRPKASSEPQLSSKKLFG